MSSKPSKRPVAAKSARAASRSSSQAGRLAAASKNQHLYFIPFLVLIGTLWFLYRQLFTFPVWFDEIIGKAIFFGVPVWIYIGLSGERQIADSFAPAKFIPGIFQGIAIGGMLGFTAVWMRLIVSGSEVMPVAMFLADGFWPEFGLALVTSFWETLLFFSFVLVVLERKYPRWSLASQVIAAAGIFVLFHVANTLMRFDASLSLPVLSMLFLFALGQALLFVRRQNAYTLVLTQAIWGMVLVLYF